jgi:ATP-dependent protease HslVU (ClpYQ) peptidase subunit
MFRCTYKGLDAIGGCSGNAFEVERWKEWFLGERDPAKKPQVGDNFRVMLVCAGKQVYYAMASYEFVFVDVPRFSTGSGADHADGAMAFGATAEQAVKIASQFDIYTGSEVDTLRPLGTE